MKNGFEKFLFRAILRKLLLYYHLFFYKNER